MTDHYRGATDEQTCIQRWWRARWEIGSIYVLNIDRVICSPNGKVGLLVEEKHVSAVDKTCTITRQLARRLGFWAGLLIYTTDTGRIYEGAVTNVELHLWSPNGDHWHTGHLSERLFDEWVCERFGARPRPGTNDFVDDFDIEGGVYASDIIAEGQVDGL